MWVSPNHPNPPRPAAPPQENGQRLATLPRGRNESEELRVTLAHYEGNPYVSLRVWARGQDGQWWPLKGKGVSIRIRELADLVEALAAAAEQFDRTAGERG